MVDVRPFRGVRYNLEKAGKAGYLIAPPYDIITPEMQSRLEERHPNNIVRLELANIECGHPEAQDEYDSARRYLEEWLTNDILMYEPEEAYYLISEEFEYRGKHTRWGLLAAVTLEEYDTKEILPHEDTMDGPKEDRYKLMEACEANLSPIFSCYFDKEGEITPVIKRAASRAPIIEADDEDGVHLKMWKVSDPDEVNTVRTAFRKKILYIADGHHRYETCLAYKRRMLELNPDQTDAPWNRTLMYLMDFDDPGLLIRPYHRGIKHHKGMNAEEFIRALGRLFHVSGIDINPGDNDEENREKTADALNEASRSGPAFAVIAAGDNNAYILKPKSESLYLLENMSEALRNLDIAILHRLALEEILEIDEGDLREGKVILYDPDDHVLWKAVRQQGWASAFFISPMRPEQVSDIAEAGLIMPQKSTYFYPKIPSGLVFHRFR